MNINLHIERLVLDRIFLSYYDLPLMQAAVETELTRLLGSGGLSDLLRSGGALSSVRTVRIQLTNDVSPARLGVQVAGAMYGGISK